LTSFPGGLPTVSLHHPDVPDSTRTGGGVQQTTTPSRTTHRIMLAALARTGHDFRIVHFLPDPGFLPHMECIVLLGDGTFLAGPRLPTPQNVPGATRGWYISCRAAAHDVTQNVHCHPHPVGNRTPKTHARRALLDSRKEKSSLRLLSSCEPRSVFSKRRRTCQGSGGSV
jgi:hypothetical protein